jgi:hypothetical protein
VWTRNDPAVVLKGIGSWCWWLSTDSCNKKPSGRVVNLVKVLSEPKLGIVSVSPWWE